MAAKRRAVRQPQAPRIRRSNPITRGLVVAITPVGGEYRDIINKRVGTAAGTAPVAGISPRGRSLNSPTAAGRVDFVGDEYSQHTSSGYTHFVVVHNVAIGDGGCLWAVASADGGDQSLYVARFGTALAVGHGNESGPQSADGRYNTLADGKTHSLCVSGPGTTARRLELDGVTILDTTGTLSPANISGPQLRLYANRGGSFEASGHFLLHLIWNRQLSQAESRSLHARWWQSLEGATSGARAPALVVASAIGPRAYPQLGGGPLAAGPVGYSLLGTDAGGTFAALTGTSASGAVGTVALSVDKAITGNAGTAAVGTVGAQITTALAGNAATGSAGTVAPSVTIPITGVSATGAVGTVTAESGGSPVSVELTGAAGTGSAGTVSPTLDKGLTGNAATGALGSVAPATAKALTGNAGTAAVGAVSAASSKTLTGDAATGAVGSVSPSLTVALAGVSATGAVGSVSAGADATQALSGVSGTGAAGTVGPSVTVALAGVSATGAVGSVTAGQPLTGVAGTGSVGTVAPSTSRGLTGASATGTAGAVGVDVTVALTGVEASGEVGSISFVSGDITIALTGVQATGAVGVLEVAGEFSAIAAAVWSYVLSNGKTAGQNVVEIRSMLDLLAPGFWNLAIEGTYTAADLLRVIAAVQAGKSTITALGGGAATVEFRAVDDSETRVTATMAGSERTEVTLNVD